MARRVSRSVAPEPAGDVSPGVTRPSPTCPSTGTTFPMNDTPVSDGGIDHGPTGRRQLSYERDRGEAPSEAVVHAVASLTDTDPLELEPLYHAIDPDTLDGVFERGPESGVEAEITIEFNDCTVTVTHDIVHVRRHEG